MEPSYESDIMLSLLTRFVFPYFRGVCFASREMIISVMRRFFLGCFGGSQDELRAGWHDWNRGVRVWYNTDAGRMVAHVLFCIQLGLESQARVFLYITGRRYLGTAILGYKTSIVTDNASLVPDTPQEVQRLAKSLDSHSDAVAEICELISKISLKGEAAVEAIQPNEVPNARALHREVNRRDLKEAADVQELTELAKKLSFAETYWPMTVHYVVRALEVIAGDTEIGMDDPMYISPAGILNDSVAFQVWSAFGPTAPSFVDAAGQDFQIPKGLAAPDPLSIRDTTTHACALPQILISGKSLDTAVTDWRNVEKFRRIRVNLNERARGYRTIGFSGQSRDAIWSALKKIPWKEEPSSSSKKRGLEDDDEDMDEGPSTKRAEPKKSKKIKTF
jgi:hypothetical protein